MMVKGKENDTKSQLIKEIVNEKDPKKREFLIDIAKALGLFGAGVILDNLALPKIFGASTPPKEVITVGQDGQPAFITQGQYEYLNMTGFVIVQPPTDKYGNPQPMVVGVAGETIVDSNGVILNSNAGTVGSKTTTAGIQEAVNYLAALGGGTVLIKSGTYVVGETITSSNASNIKLLGSGRSTIIKPSGSFNALGNNFSAKDFIWVDSSGTQWDLTVDPNVISNSISSLNNTISSPQPRTRRYVYGTVSSGNQTSPFSFQLEYTFQSLNNNQPLYFESLLLFCIAFFYNSNGTGSAMYNFTVKQPMFSITNYVPIYYWSYTSYANGAGQPYISTPILKFSNPYWMYIQNTFLNVNITSSNSSSYYYVAYLYMYAVI